VVAGLPGLRVAVAWGDGDAVCGTDEGVGEAAAAPLVSGGEAAEPSDALGGELEQPVAPAATQSAAATRLRFSMRQTVAGLG
jgi:hypothetical protein